MTEASEKKIRKHIAELIVDRYDREVSANEYRAIQELPLGKFEDLDDKSKNGIRIWDLLWAFEHGTREASLLEEAGRLIWVQVINEPKPNRNLAGHAEEQEAFVEECRRRNVAAPKPAKGRTRDIPKEPKKPKPRKEPKAKKSQEVLREGETLVLFGGPPKNQDQEPRVLSEWDVDAIVPPRKRSKYTHGPLLQRDIHSQSHSLTMGGSQGKEVGGYSKPTTAQGKPASGTLITRDEGISPIPLPSEIPTASQTSNPQSQSSDQTSLPTYPTKISPPETPNRDAIRQAANKYYTSQGNQERPQPYAPGNFSKYILEKDG